GSKTSKAIALLPFDVKFTLLPQTGRTEPNVCFISFVPTLGREFHHAVVLAAPLDQTKPPSFWPQWPDEDPAPRTAVLAWRGGTRTAHLDGVPNYHRVRQ